METLALNLSVPEKDEFDVIVCGGGVAGCAAALEAARRGRKTLLLEKSCMLGGLATLGLVNYFVPMCNRRGKLICRGMAEEFLKLAISIGYNTLPKEWKNGEPKYGASNPCHSEFDPNLFAMQLAELLDKAGVTILFDVGALMPVMDGPLCRGIVVSGKNGLFYHPARVVIDATGDAEIMAKAGVPVADGANFFSYFPREITFTSCADALSSGEIRRALRVFPGGEANLYGGGHPEGMPLFYGADPAVTTDYLLKNQKLILERRRADPDAKDKLFASIPGMPQFRTVRRIVGDFTLSEHHAFCHFEDSVAAINDFDRKDLLYEIPLRCLTRRGFDNLIAAGRCISAEGYAWDVVRVIPPAILTGQAAAVCACRAMDESRPVADIDVKAAQNRIVLNKAYVHFPDELVPRSITPTWLEA
ncbi:MAG: FAD-dependent oxidoreductase [Clostridia bacterium]|nr:FAD-dependent oxidoreductase [Clostridia bacterium]